MASTTSCPISGSSSPPHDSDVSPSPMSLWRLKEGLHDHGALSETLWPMSGSGSGSSVLSRRMAGAVGCCCSGGIVREIDSGRDRDRGGDSSASLPGTDDGTPDKPACTRHRVTSALSSSRSRVRASIWRICSWCRSIDSWTTMCLDKRLASASSRLGSSSASSCCS